jgi:hypothetical protein
MAGEYISDAELADYIEQGLKIPNVEEVLLVYVKGTETEGYQACALGLAWIGKVGDAAEADQQLRKEIGFQQTEARRVLAGLLGIDPNLAYALDVAHQPRDGWSAAVIARRLREGEWLCG